MSFEMPSVEKNPTKADNIFATGVNELSQSQDKTIDLAYSGGTKEVKNARSEFGTKVAKLEISISNLAESSTDALGYSEEWLSNKQKELFRLATDIERYIDTTPVPDFINPESDEQRKYMQLIDNVRDQLSQFQSDAGKNGATKESILASYDNLNTSLQALELFTDSRRERFSEEN